MELQIQDLVASIKKEGIEAAEKEAKRITDEAQARADSTVSAAKAQAEKTLEDARKEIEILRQSAKVSAEQAKRDAVLSFRREMEEQYRKLLARDIKKAVSGDSLGKLIQAAVADKDVSKLSAEVSEVSDSLKAQLADEIRSGLEIKPVKGIDAGFRLASKDGSGYFDCTDEELARMLEPFFGNMSI